MTTYPMPPAAPVGMPPVNSATPFPQPSLPPEYGMDPTDAALLASSPNLQPYVGMPTPTSYQPAGPVAYAAQMSAMYKLTGGAISAENDPRTWTPDDAAQQTNAAIAKIAQVNPELAKELAEQNGMQVPDDGQSAWDMLMGGVGKVLEVTHLDDVMELISRPAHILPEIIMDWGKEDVWKNVGDALLGKSDVSWDDVLVEKMGMERNIFTAALGLVGDIALDPLTYLPLGRLMGLGREATSMTAGKALSAGVVHEAAEITSMKAMGATAADLAGAYSSKALASADDIAELTRIAFENGARTLDEVGAMAFSASDVATQAAAKARTGVRGALERASARAGRGPAVLQDEANALLNKVQTAMKGVDADALPGVINTAASEAATNGLKVITAASNEAVKMAYRGNFAKAVEVLTKKTGWDAKYAEDALKRWVKEGTGITPGALGKAKYMRGKAAATQLGGWRFHLNIPILGVRIAPQRVLPKLIPQLDFGLGRRLFAGMSGEMRFVRLLKKGGEREFAAYDMFVEKGFSGLKDNFPDIAKKIAGPGALSRPGSVFMSASEQVGKLTGKFSPHAALLRKGGLGGIRLAQLSRQAPGIHELALRDMQSVVLSDGETVLNGPQVKEFIDRAFPSQLLSKPGEVTDAARAELSRKLDRYVALSPHDDVASALTDAETKELRELEDWFSAQSEDGLEAAKVLKRQAGQSDTVPDKSGVPANNDRYGYDHKDELTPADAAKAAGESQHEYLHDGVYVIDGNGRPLDGAIDEEALQDVALPGGVVARGVPVRRARDGINAPSTGPTTRELNTAQRAVDRARAELDAIEREVPTEGVFVGDPLELEARRVAAQDKLDLANASLHTLETPSQELVVSAKNILDVDLRTGGQAVTEGTAGANIPKEIADHVRALMDEAEMTAKAIDETAEALMDPELRKLAQQVREVGDNVPAGVTRTLAHDGRDGIRVLTNGPDGETIEQIIVFRRAGDGSIPVARINRNAPHAVQRGGTPIRAATPEAYDAVRRLKGAKDLPGGSKVALDRLIQETSHLPWDEAEATIRAQLRAWGMDVPPNKTVLEPDFIKALAGKQEAKARAMVAQQFGKSVRTLERLGLTSSVENGGLVGMERVRWALGASPAAVNTMADDAKQAAQRNAVFLEEKLRPLAQQAEQAARKVQDGHDAFETTLKSVDNVTYEKMLGARGVPVADDASDILVVAQMQHRAVDLGDGMWMTVDDNGSKVFYQTDVSELDDVFGDSPPIGTLEDLAGDGYTIVMHHTPNAKVRTIIDSGGVKRSTKGVVAGDRSGVFAFPLSHSGRVAPGQTAIAIRVPTASLHAAGNSGAVVADLDVAGDIVGTYPGAQVIGTRAIGPDGRLLDASDAGRVGVRERLLDADYREAGVFDAADPGLAITERMKAAGVSGALEKRAAAKGHATAQEALEAEKAAAQDAFGKAHIEQTAAIGEVERLKTLMTTEAAQVRPALIPKTEMSMTSAGFEELDIPGFEGLVMPTFMAQELQRAVNGFKGLDSVHAEFRRFNSWWKSHATWMWPSFHIRNMYGAFFNNLIGGVDIKDYIMAGRLRFAAREFESTGKAGKWGNKLIRETDPDMLEIMKMNGQFTMMGKSVDELTYGDLAEMTASMGVVSSNGQPLMDARLSASETERGGQVWVEKHAATKPYANFAKGVGTGTENVMRSAAFVRGMKTYGTAPEARVFTMLRHGDYADLTDFEYGVVRDIIPFYKWMRTNTPFQVHQLLESPAKLLAVGKLQNAAYVAAGVDPDEAKYKMPKWMGESFNIPFGSADENGMFDMVSLDLPMSDLHKTATDYFTSTLPLFQPIFENFIAKKDLFTGAPMDGKPIPLTGIWNMPGIRDILKVTQFADEGADGQLFTTDAKRNMLAVIPEVTKFKDWLWADPERTNSRIAGFTSAMLAVPLRAEDEAAMTSAEMDFYYGTVEPEMNRLREMGYPLPTVAQLEATVGTVNQALALQGITPRQPATPTYGVAA